MVLNDTTLVWYGPQLAHYLTHFGISNGNPYDFWQNGVARLVVWVGPAGTYPNYRNTLNCLSARASGYVPWTGPAGDPAYYVEDVLASGASVTFDFMGPGECG